MDKDELLKELASMSNAELAAVDQELAVNQRRQTALRVYEELIDSQGTDELVQAVTAVTEARTEQAEEAPAKAPAKAEAEAPVEPEADTKDK